jgi:hypothetical protein
MGQANQSIEDPRVVLLKAKIKPGCIVHLPCDFIDNPHNKFMVLLYIEWDSELFLVFLINSRIHPLIERDPNLKACQIKVKKLKYTFLDHDSFIDCSRVFDDVDVPKALQHLLDFPNDLKCILDDKERIEIIQAVNSADSITDFDKELIIASLGS